LLTSTLTENHPQSTDFQPNLQPTRRQGELIRGKAAMLSVITGKDWRDIGGFDRV
jgi:hypothetical protein